MNREEYIDLITGVLGAHSCADYSAACTCGKRLYNTNLGVDGTGAMTLGRHRAEKILDALGLGLEVAIT